MLGKTSRGVSLVRCIHYTHKYFGGTGPRHVMYWLLSWYWPDISFQIALLRIQVAHLIKQLIKATT